MVEHTSVSGSVTLPVTVGGWVRALDPRVIDAAWAAVEHLLPRRPVDDHPLGCHRPRIADKVCFTGIVYRLALGCSWVDAGRLVGVGQATLRRRRDEWADAGVFDALVNEAIAGYDRIRGLDLSEVSVDGSLHKAPCGGEGTGPNPTDRAKKGWKWSIASEAAGIPIGWAIDGANRHDIRLLGPTLDTVSARGLDLDIDTLHLDRGYDANTVRTDLAAREIDEAVIARRRRRGEPKIAGKRPLLLGLRWTVERTNSWLSNHGQLRRNTDRCSSHRLAQLALAIVLIITAKLIDWHDRWNRP
jgi:transposase